VTEPITQARSQDGIERVTDPVIVSLSSQVVYGHVGNCAAVPALQALGFEVLALPTVLLAHHPGHRPPRGRMFAAEEVAALLEGIDEVGALARACGVLTGYLGLPATAGVATDAVKRLRRHKPAALYLCDPVIGDNGRVYVRDGVEQAIREQLLPLADVLTPNHFELERLAGRPVASLEQAVSAARALIQLGPKVVVVTSVQHGQAATDQVETLAVTADAVWVATCLRLGRVPNGGGDLLAALLLGRLASGYSLPDALGHAVSAVFAVLSASEGEPELRLVAGRGHLVAPPNLAVRLLDLP
jgi:pyridoxine kinase